jgi:hypothetical protein
MLCHNIIRAQTTRVVAQLSGRNLRPYVTRIDVQADTSADFDLEESDGIAALPGKRNGC